MRLSLWSIVPLVPEACKTLIDNGFTITAEKSDARFFKDEGIQRWKELIKRFTDGKGTILDLEFLQDDSGRVGNSLQRWFLGRRVAAFGYHAGFTGSAVGIDIWCHNTNPALGKFPPIKPYPNQDRLIRAIKLRLATAVQANKGSYPKIMVMGAKGRCGGGAVDFAKAVGIPETNILGWDMAETVKGGPFDEILGVDIFINCIYLSSKNPTLPYTGKHCQAFPSTQVMVDVSCDYTSPNNPVPVYDRATYFDKPTLQVQAGSSNPLSK
ncbi:Saccharopine dehydrogenase [Entomophthora muscae]|uniref:Saccharopine dehydrogenase n=1 Tax=Entomophthora muscae TaxID=34485 RepID=A0ACC2S0E6_9FUNG|nr:Saccharopine dehydrogenase [Entomophthora muscae]